MQQAYYWIVNNMGFIYTWSGILAVVAILYFSFSKYGKIKFGEPNEKPEYKGFTWAATMFTAGIAAAILYWAPIEWTEYFKSPALNIEPLTAEAAEWAGAYTFFHWGVIPWALYAISSLPIAYCYFVRKEPVLKVSEACREVLGKQSDGIIGKTFDIMFILSMIMGTTTEIGIAVPYVTTAVCTLINTEPNITWMLIVLAATTITFSFAAYFGLKRGIAKLGSATSALGLSILAFIFIFGPTLFIISMSTTSIGVFAQNFIRMATWMDPILNGGFVQSWTQFFWAWWMSASLFMGLFIARMARGRTVKNVLLGSVGYGSLGCGLFFWVMGSYTMDLHFSGTLDMLESITSIGQNATIMQALQMLPLGKILIGACALCGIMLLATTYDASATSIAAVSQRRLHQGEDPNSKLVLFWSILMVLIPAGILIANGPFTTIQSATVVGSLPIAFIMIVEIISFVKMVRNDNQKINLK